MDVTRAIDLLRAADGDPAQLALATLEIELDSQSPHMRRVVEAASVPHWFDERILAALLDEDLRPESKTWFQAVRALSSIEGRHRFNVHETTRLALRKRLLREESQRLHALSARAVSAFGRADVHDRIERVFHVLLADPSTASSELRSLLLAVSIKNESLLALAGALREYQSIEWPASARGWAFVSDAYASRDYKASPLTAELAAAACQAFSLATDAVGTQMAYWILGDAQLALGDSEAAIKSYASAHDYGERLHASDRENLEWQRDLSVLARKRSATCSGAGRPCGGAGQLPGLARDRRAAGQGRPGQRRLAARPLGVARQDRRRAARAGRPGGGAGQLPGLARDRERLAKADPGNAGWQRDLSVSHDKIGDVQRAQGDLAAALTSYQASLAIAERLAKADPGNAGWQRDLSVSHDKIGDVQRAQGDLAAALTSYQASLAIAERLAKADPGNAGWQRDLSVSHNKIGDVQRRAGRPGGGADQLPGLARDRRAAGRRPTPAMPAGSATSRSRTTRSATCSVRRATCRRRWQLPGLARDRRAAGQGRPRQCRLAARPLGLARQDRRRAACAGRPGGGADQLPGLARDRERLAKADPGNAGWQRDLSVSHDKIGDVQRAQGDLAAALTSYQASLAIAERLAKADPGNAGWQRDLSVSHDKIGDVQRAQGDLAAALTSYQASLAIRERLAKADPGNAGWQRDLSVSHNKIGDVQVAQGNLPAALTATRPRSPSTSVWPKPTPATPAGSATSRCRTTRSATCWRRRATWRRR